MAEDLRELEERVARLEERFAGAERDRPDPWVGQSLAPPGPMPALAGPRLFPDEVPSGVVVMWGGAIVDIPYGWTLCDGGNDSLGNATPDLSSKFIVGYKAADGDYGALGGTGGFKLHGPTENNHTDHTIGGRVYTVTDPAQTQFVTTNDHSETDNRPPYYVLAFIRKD